MVIIKVWCLPALSESELRRLHVAIVKAVVDMKKPDLENQSDMLCLFPKDLMEYGLGEIIFVEACGFTKKQIGTYKEHSQVVKTLSLVTHTFFLGKARVVCKVAVDGDDWGNWDSAKNRSLVGSVGEKVFLKLDEGVAKRSPGPQAP